MLSRSTVSELLKLSKASKLSLSTYFPKGTYYFYAYPSGEASGFLNNVPPASEELVSARPLVCAGNDVRVVTFAAPVSPFAKELIENGTGLPLNHKRKICVLPAEIDGRIEGEARNERIKQSLKQTVPVGSLVMAQPFMDTDLLHLYQISPILTQWLNDKHNMGSFIPKQYIPARYAIYTNGNSFSKARTTYPMPCVVKVSSSSAGDGVYICRNTKELEQVRSDLNTTVGTIFVEQYVEAKANYGVQFGIPEDPDLPIDIIGISQQITTDDGEFIGGIIDSEAFNPDLEQVKEALLNEILPTVRDYGWYGVGCIDILIDKSGANYIIDCNFRMTGMTAFLMLVSNRQIRRPLLSFNGEYRGSQENFKHMLGSFNQENSGLNLSVRTLAATNYGGICRFNAVFMAKNKAAFPIGAQKLLSLGINSKALKHLYGKA